MSESTTTPAPATADGQTAPVVMRATGLHKRFGGQVILDEAEFELRRGEIVLLRGPNGSGKTTLLNILTGNLEPDAGNIEIAAEQALGTENFTFPPSWLGGLNPIDHFTPERIANEGVGRTWQDIRLFPTHSLRDNVVLAMKNQTGENPLAVFFKRSTIEREESEWGKQADGLLSRFGLGGRETSSADMISLGQSKRVAIARTVQAGARILFLDEPLAALDANGIRDIMGLLDELVKEHAVTLVIVEHVFNIPKVLDLATTVWTIDDATIRIESPEDVRKESFHNEGDALRPWLSELAGSEDAIVDVELPGGALLSHVKLDPAAADQPGLDIKDLVVHRGRRPVIGRTDTDGSVEGLSFRVPRGSLAVLQAPNGWGKTTFLEALSGIIPIASGEMHIYGTAVHKIPTWSRISRGLSVMQSRDNAFPNLSVDESLKLAAVEDPPENVRPFMGRRISDLSGGERQKVAAACSLANATDTVTILDEPFGMLDVASIPKLQAEIAANKNGATLILVPAASQS